MNKDIVILDLGNSNIELKQDIENETLWGTANHIANIFDIDRTGVVRHKNDILKDKELDKSTCANFAHVKGKEAPEWYNLDMMIAIGYRVNSKKATEFRKKATQIIKSFITKGVVVNTDKISNGELAKILRKLRNEEKSFYNIIKRVFKDSSSDYDIASQQQKQKFFSLVQDKFLFAVAGKTACQLMLERADCKKSNMGLCNFEGKVPSTKDIVIGKNYLNEKELEELEILCENFLGFCHLKAFRGQEMTFDEITYKLNSFLEFNGYQPFNTYIQPDRKNANIYAKNQLKEYKRKLKLKNKGK